ncbi:MAG: polyprenyl synthetase family protein [Dissulfuribacterales bacterium]
MTTRFFELKTYLKGRQELINAHLKQLIPSDTSPAFRLFEAMRYSLMAGGKRLRPILALAAFDAVNHKRLPIETAMPFACALECIHTYSLIHDDLPAMDDDALRRGIPTCHKKFGEAIAILAGDALLTLAFDICSNSPSECPISATTRLKAINLMAQAAGMNGMVAGQTADMELEGREISEKELDYIHSRKTGALLQASVLLGGILAETSERNLQALTQYGAHIGLAFQIRDDILDIEGDEKIMGKPKGSDERKKKATWPAVYGMKQAKARMQELCKLAIQDIATLNDQAVPLKAIAEYVMRRDH